MKAQIVVVGVVAAFLLATPALSTQGALVDGPVLGRGTLDDRTKLKIKSEESDVVDQHVTIAPGGHTGWHSHPGPAVVVVSAGTLTLYNADDRKCRPQSYSAGESFIDPGRGNVHIGRNEGPTSVELYVTYLDVPVGGAFRIDAAGSGKCSF